MYISRNQLEQQKFKFGELGLGLIHSKKKVRH